VSAKYVLSKITQKYNLNFTTLYIDSNKPLLKKYGSKVPVILANDEEIGCLKIRHSDIRSKIELLLASTQPNT
jgi:hypothetical protein